MAQLAERVAQAALDGLASAAGRGGDFLQRQPAFLGEQEGLALGRGQRGEGAGEAGSEVGPGVPGGRVIVRRGRQGVGVEVAIVERRGIACVAAVVVDQAMVGDAVEPGREAGQRLIVGAGGDDAQPDVLVKLLGNACVAALVREVAVKASAVAPEQRLERCGITIAVGEHEAFVARRIIHRPQCSSGQGDTLLALFSGSTATAGNGPPHRQVSRSCCGQGAGHRGLHAPGRAPPSAAPVQAAFFGSTMPSQVFCQKR
jgi:hypothetical protein